MAAPLRRVNGTQSACRCGAAGKTKVLLEIAREGFDRLYQPATGPLVELEQFSAVRHHLKHPSAGAGARLVGLFGSYA